MMTKLTLSQARLQTFLTCRRRFFLRYQARLPWPGRVLDVALETAVSRGKQFHLLLERHFLGLAVDGATIPDGDLRRYWTQFQASGLEIPDGTRLPEMRLSVPIGEHMLLGRYDLLVVHGAADAPSIDIFDWKTGRPQSVAQLQETWQTRIYLALLAEGGGALCGAGQDAPSIPPENLAITYWYVDDPQNPRTIRYSQTAHQQNWAEIQAIVAQIEGCLHTETWPKVESWNPCRDCAYTAVCGRQE